MSIEASGDLPSLVSAADLRRMALQCATQADLAEDDDTERTRLLKMREALLTLAVNQDWLDGRSAG